MNLVTNNHLAEIIQDVVKQYPEIWAHLSTGAQLAMKKKRRISNPLADRGKLEKRLKKVLGSQFDREGKQFLSLLGTPPDIGNVPNSFWAKENVLMANAIMPELLGISRTQAQGLADQMSIGVDWGMVNERAVRAARLQTDTLIQQFMQTSQAGTKLTWEKFFQEGQSVGMTVAEYFEQNNITMGDLEAFFQPYFGLERAEMIAVTETTRASVLGELALVDEIRSQNPDIIFTPVWETDNDDIVCELCGPRNQHASGVEYADGNWDIETDGPPPLHVNCRCNLSHDIGIRE
jgi:hypothetical protein